MIPMLLEFHFNDILNWIGGFLPLCIAGIACYLIGQLGVQIRSGITILKYVSKAKQEAKSQGMILTPKGTALQQKGKLKIILPIIALILFYTCVLLFVTSTKYQIGALLLLIPLLLGFFGIFLVPSVGEE
jgi:hypothetical protein